jgi:hypothetical protein
MLFDDRFHPNNSDNEDYYSTGSVGGDNWGAGDENDNYSYNEGSVSVYSNRNRPVNLNSKQRKLYESLKATDKGYQKIRRMNNGITSNIEMYTTGLTPGTTIRDAVTGARYPGLLVGSRNEDQFFKIKYTGIPGHLYFFTPDEFERHYKTRLSQTLKDKWAEKYQAYQKKYGDKSQ